MNLVSRKFWTRREGIGRWLGVSHRTGGAISYWIFKAYGYVVSRTNVQRVTNLGSEIPENQLMLSEFDKEIKRCIKDDEFRVDGYLPDPVELADMLEDEEGF